MNRKKFFLENLRVTTIYETKHSSYLIDKFLSSYRFALFVTKTVVALRLVVHGLAHASLAYYSYISKYSIESLLNSKHYPACL